MKKSRILFAAPSLDFLLYYKSGLSKVFIDHGYDITWNSPVIELKNKKEILIPKDIKTIFWKSSRKGLIPFLRMNLSYLRFVLLNNSKVTIISHTIYSNLSCIFTYYLLRKKHLKLIVFVSGFGPSRIRDSLRFRLIGRIYLFILKYISRKKNILVVTLNFEDKRIVQDFSTLRKVLYLKESGITEEDIKFGKQSIIEKNKDLEKKTINCGFFGRFLLEKGINDFKEIIEISNTHNYQFNFLMGGSSDIYNSSSVSDKTFFNDINNLKIYNDPDYSEFFKKIDILLFPSYREGYPCFLLRSMAFGVVPIIYPNPGMTEDILDNFNGFIAKYTHPNAIFSELIKLNNNRKLLKEISNNAREYALQKFQSQTYRDNKMFQKLDSFIKE